MTPFSTYFGKMQLKMKWGTTHQRKKIITFSGSNGAITEIVPDFFGSPRNLFPKKCGPWEFGPQEIWASRKLVPAWKCYVMIFMQGSNFSGPKFLWDQISWGPKRTGAQMGPGTISVIAKATPWLSTRLDGPWEIRFNTAPCWYGF